MLIKGLPATLFDWVILMVGSPIRFLNNIQQNVPFKRFGTIEELVNVIEMLVKVEYISGTSIKVNGGLDF